MGCLYGVYMDLETLSRALLDVVSKKVAAGQLELPALPWNKPQMAVLLQGRPDPAAFVQLLEVDPLLLHEVTRVLPKRPQRLTSVSGLVQAVGIANVRQVVSVVARRRHPEPRDPDLKQAYERICAHEVATASIARHVAVHARLPNADEVQLCALVAGAAAPIVGLHLLDLERAAARARGVSAMSPTAFMRLVQEVAPKVADLLVRRVSIDPFPLKALAEPTEFDPVARTSPENCMRIARLVVERGGILVGDVDEARIEGGLMVGRSLLEVRDDALGHMMEAAQDIARECVF